MIQVHELTFTYDGDSLPVWNRVCCSFQEKTLNLILGPSGCGKSTFLYALNGTVPSCYGGNLSGRVLLDNEEITAIGSSELASRIGLVFQDPECQFCTFTVEDELAFGPENLGLSSEKISQKIDRALKLVHMESFRANLLSELSGGQKQKIAIACVLAMDPAVLLLDEPTANLDAASRSEIFQLLDELSHREGKTVILVEHNLDGILSRIDQLLVFDQKGTMRLQGPCKEVIGSLLFCPDYADIPVFLSQELLILRQWVSACTDEISRGVLWDYFRSGDLRDVSKLSVLLASPLKSEIPVSRSSKESAAPLLSLERVGFSYQIPGQEKKGSRFSKAVLKQVSFQVYDGDFIAILGENGAGKSTLLNLIFGALTCNCGIIRLLGRELQSFSRKELYQKMGLVFQNPEWQFVSTRVEDELRFSLKHSGLTEEEKNERVEASLRRFHLTDDRDKNPFALSQGQKRRLSVATMLLTGQKILFFDEPTYGQDFEQREELLHMIQSLNENGTTVVMVTHDLSAAAQYARRVLLLQDGEIAFDGEPDKLFLNEALLRRSRLEQPGLLPYSQILNRRFPWIPVTGNMGLLLQKLISGTKENLEHVCV